MERRRLGSSDLGLTRVGVGTAPIGSGPGWWVSWGPQDRGDAIRAIGTALDLGVNWIDTAPFYGWGRAEELVVPIEETWSEIMQLVAEGKVRHGGLSNHPPDLVERALAVGPVVSLQHQYSLLAREAERDVLPFARARGIGVLTWAPLASGFLTDRSSLDALAEDDFRRGHAFADLRLEPLLAALEGAAGSPQAGAIAWVLANPAATAAIVCVRNELVSFAAACLDEDALRRIEAVRPE